MTVLRWIAGILGVVVMGASGLVFVYLLAMACAFGSPNGNCRTGPEQFFTGEAVLLFWMPFAFGLWIVCAAIWGGTGPKPVRVTLWSIPVGLVLLGWGISRPSGFFYGQPASVQLGLESYHDHPVVVTRITLNGAEVFLPRPEAVRSSGDLRGPRWGHSQAMSRPWPIASGGQIEVEVDWTDLRSGEAWTASVTGPLTQVDVREGWGAGPVAELSLVFGPNGTLVVASDRLSSSGTWELTPVDVARGCGTRVPSQDKVDWDWEAMGVHGDRAQRLRSPARPIPVEPLAALPQPPFLCSPPS